MRIKTILLRALLLSVFWLLFTSPALAQERTHCAVPNTYRVQPGDVLSAVAERFGTDVGTLMELNNLTDPDHIYVGQLLYLPCPIRPEDEVMGSLLTGMVTGLALPRVPPSSSSLALWNAHHEARAHWHTLLPTGELTWYPRKAKPGDTVIVRVLPHAQTPITVSVRVFDAWYPLVKTGQAYQGFVPLHGLVLPGLLRVTLGLNITPTLTHTVNIPVWVEEGDFPSQKIVLPPGKGNLLAAQTLEEEAVYVAEVWARSQGPPRWQGPFSWPIDIEKWPTTSPYGVRRIYNEGVVRGYHTGQDIAAPEGTPVYAPAAGVVILAEPLQVRGNAVIIDHGAGVTSNYWHLSEIAVKAGQTVARGEVIGKVGTTGLSTGAHLHWEMRIYGIPVNPVPWTQDPGPATGWKAQR